MSIRTPCFTPDDFFCDLDADLVLVSCDRTIFRTHRCILRAVSPFFRDMLSLPQPEPHSTSPDNSLISMAEDSPTINLLLKFCYPRTLCPEPSLSDPRDLRRALTLARKFDIDVIREAAERALERLASSSPESAYALAYAYELPKAVRAAARATLRMASPFKYTTGTPEAPELASLSAVALVQLFRYHDAVVATMKELADSKRLVHWIPHQETFLTGPEGPFIAPAACSHDLTAITFAHGQDAPAAAWVKSWWWEFVCASVKHKSTACSPATLESALRKPLMKALLSVARCEFCGSANAEEVLDRTLVRLRDEIERRLANVGFATIALSQRTLITKSLGTSRYDVLIIHTWLISLDSYYSRGCTPSF